MKKIRLITILILIYLFSVCTSAAELLIPGGQVIGLELQDGTVTVAAFHHELGQNAKKAGLQEGDRILGIGNTRIHNGADIRSALTGVTGNVQLSILRKGKAKQLTLTPVTTPEGPKLGVYLKYGTSGVGTVTYYDPEKGCYGALGHGVSTKDGKLLSVSSGNIFDARVRQIKKGTCGHPGQLMGEVTVPEPIGTVRKNTAQGIFGTMKGTPDTDPLPVADQSEIHTGKATIRSTLEKQVQEYSVEILKIYPSSPGRTRNMLIKITDPALLETTGGIVQGMSGSPIIQDGKLIGAVTHVLVNDPTTGYGIFIENMLDAAA